MPSLSRHLYVEVKTDSVDFACFVVSFPLKRNEMQLADHLFCPLCGASGAISFHTDRQRDYFRCPECALVFVPPSQFLSPDEEKSRYELHENDPSNEGYRRFLSRLFTPLSERLEPRSHGLDFGSGPGPTLSRMFEEAGHTMDIYDPFYAPNPHVFERQYDFITASEVVEHLHRPREELDRLWSMLKPCGWLGIMTKRVTDVAAFTRWRYKNDDTHVIFFSRATFAWLADRWTAELLFDGADVALYRKN